MYENRYTQGRIINAMTYIPRSSDGQGSASSPIPKMVKKKRTFRVFGFFGTLALVLAVLGTIGVLVFEYTSEKQLEAAKAELKNVASATGDFEAKINEIRIYDAQLVTAEKMLDNHLTVSKLFNELEFITKETIQFKLFEYSYDPGFEATLTLGGNTEEFTSVVLQEMQFDSVDSPFELVIVDDVTKSNQVESEDGSVSVDDDKVSFNVTGLLKAGRMSYTGTETQESSYEQQEPQVDFTDDTTENTEDENVTESDQDEEAIEQDNQ